MPESDLKVFRFYIEGTFFRGRLQASSMEEAKFYLSRFHFGPFREIPRAGGGVAYEGNKILIESAELNHPLDFSTAEKL